MAVVNCKICGHIFEDRLEKKICIECSRADDKIFLAVREFLYEYPNSKIFEVIEALSDDGIDVTEKEIIRYIRMGRLIITDENPFIIITCEVCGASIRTGRLCEKCKSSFLKGMKPEEKGFYVKRSKPKNSSVMYTARRK